VSDYNFGSFDLDDMSGAGEPDSTGQQGPKWFRDYMDKVSGQLKAIQAENEALKAEKKQQAVGEALKAKGYNPAAAGLFTGEPDKLDEWLTANGAALAKLTPEGQQPEGEQQTQQGPPATTVPADGQEQIQRMQEQGTQGVAAPQGTDAEMAAALKAADGEAFVKLMQSQGSQYNWGDYIN
jgi:hypothetical protein